MEARPTEVSWSRRALARAIAALVAVAVTLTWSATSARAESEDATAARAAFVEGTQLVKNAQWAEALASFERAAAIRKHAVTTFNVGGCERAMGRYTRARATFARALTENDAAGGKELPPSLAADAKAYVAEIDRLLARLTITLVPSDATLAVDGRPLEVLPLASASASAGATSAAGTPVTAAGLRASGLGEAPPASTFVVMLDPGAHVFTFSHKGFGDLVRRETLEPGSARAERLELAKLPATLHVSSNLEGAIVTVNNADVGPAPADVLRPAGSYRVTVKHEGFVPYEAQVAVRAGEQANLRAALVEDKPSILKRWWFWTAAGVVVAGAAAGTYFATRTPERAQVPSGTLGWSVNVR